MRYVGSQFPEQVANLCPVHWKYSLLLALYERPAASCLIEKMVIISPHLLSFCSAPSGGLGTFSVSSPFFCCFLLFIYFGVISFSSPETAMAPHSSTLAWKIPWTEEPGRLQSVGLLRVRHDQVTSLSLFTFMHWRRKWQPTPVFLPWESQGWGSLVGCHLWGCTELDMTEVT